MQLVSFYTTWKYQKTKELRVMIFKRQKIKHIFEIHILSEYLVEQKKILKMFGSFAR